MNKNQIKNNDYSVCRSNFTVILNTVSPSFRFTFGLLKTSEETIYLSTNYNQLTYRRYDIGRGGRLDTRAETIVFDTRDRQC